MPYKLYLAVTPDEMELPITIADSMIKLAVLLGKNPSTLYKNLYRRVPACAARMVHEPSYRVRVVECEEDSE